MRLPDWCKTNTEPAGVLTRELLENAFEQIERAQLPVRTSLPVVPPDLTRPVQVIREGICPICGKPLDRNATYETLVSPRGEPTKAIAFGRCEPCGWWFAANGADLFAAADWWVSQDPHGRHFLTACEP